MREIVDQRRMNLESIDIAYLSLGPRRVVRQVLDVAVAVSLISIMKQGYSVLMSQDVKGSKSIV
jgi:hypothetical protein